MRYLIPKKNICQDCKHAKDKFHDSCYCTYYGYIRSKPKKDCWGWEQRTEKDNKEEKE